MLKDIGDSKRINYHLHSQDGGCPELITQVKLKRQCCGFCFVLSLLPKRNQNNKRSRFIPS
jgi:hypothetical protein